MSRAGVKLSPTPNISNLTISSKNGQARRRILLPVSEKNISADEFMAAAIGDVNWLKQSLRDPLDGVNYDKNGLTALHLASIHGRLDCIKLLIEKYKLMVDEPSTTGWRAVHLVISNQTGKRALQCLAYVLERGADPSITNEDGITPCHQAASEGHVQCLKFLIELGASLDEHDRRGHTPLDLAKLWGHQKCARIIATELWHRDKQHVAREMKNLQKVKIQEILRSLQQQPNPEHRPHQSLISKESLQKSNSYQGGSKQIVKYSEKSRLNINSPGGISSGYAKSTTATVTEQRTDITDESWMHDGAVTLPSTFRPAIASATYVNPVCWNISTNLPGTKYVSNLGDAYPRDEYTMMPSDGSAPKYFDGTFNHGNNQNNMRVNLLRHLSTDDIDLPKETITKFMLKDASILERPVLFKPVHIWDIHSKKKYSEDVVPKSEVMIHLSDDLQSYMFKKSLQPAAPASRCSSQETSTPVSERSKVGISDNMAWSLGNLSKPLYFGAFQSV